MPHPAAERESAILRMPPIRLQRRFLRLAIALQRRCTTGASLHPMLDERAWRANCIVKTIDEEHRWLARPREPLPDRSFRGIDRRRFQNNSELRSVNPSVAALRLPMVNQIENHHKPIPAAL